MPSRMWQMIVLFSGLISADGQDGGYESGGASGGSIWIQTNGFHGNGVLQSNGGAGVWGRTSLSDNFLFHLNLVQQVQQMF